MGRDQRWLSLLAMAVGLLALLGFRSGVAGKVTAPTNRLFAVAQPALPRDFTLPRPIVAPDGAWNQTATSATVLPESDEQILTTYQITDKWSLWTGGTQLRGANIYQRRVYPELDGPDFMGPGSVGPPHTQEDFDRLAALGANYVNISHPGLFTETPPFALDSGIQNNLDNLLDMIAQADMFAVISFRTGPGRSEFTFFWDEAGDWFDASYLNDSVWQDQAAQDAWVDMWRYTAERYRGNPIVAGYDLMVEPNSNEVGSHPFNDPLDIWDPDEFYAQYGDSLYDWNQLYPRITAAIREVDTDTPILIGGNGYSAIDWLLYLEPTGDPRTVYTVHQYEPFKYTHQDSGVQECSYPGTCDVDWDNQPETFNGAWLNGRLSTIDTFIATHNVPVAVNEFGLVRWTPSADIFMDDQMDLFEQRGLNHALWAWDPAWEPWTQVVDAFNFRHGPDPNNHADVESSALMDIIFEHWGHNTIHPSSMPPPASACLSDANGNERVDVVDMMSTAQTPACVYYYLPLLANSWRQSWPPGEQGG